MSTTVLHVVDNQYIFVFFALHLSILFLINLVYFHVVAAFKKSCILCADTLIKDIMQGVP